MSERGAAPGGAREGDPEEPLDLEELRQARELAAALAGEEPRDGPAAGRRELDPEVAEALRGAALLALAREPELAAGDVERLAAELPGAAGAAGAAGAVGGEAARGGTAGALASAGAGSGAGARGGTAGALAGPRRAGRWMNSRLAAVAAVAAAVVAVVLVEAGLTALRQRGPAPGAAAAAARGQAESLVASLLPPGGSPAGRARVIEATARARYLAAREGR